MGNQQSFGGGDKKRGGSDKDKDGKQKKKWEPPAPATRVGKRQRRMKGAGEGSERLPAITPASQCKLRLLKLERVKDYLLMEEEFVTNQERLRPAEEKNEEETSKVKKTFILLIYNAIGVLLRLCVCVRRVAGWLCARLEGVWVGCRSGRSVCVSIYTRHIQREREREKERETLGGTAAFPAFFLVLYMCAFV